MIVLGKQIKSVLAEHSEISVPLLQKELGISYAQATEAVSTMENKGWIRYAGGINYQVLYDPYQERQESAPIAKPTVVKEEPQKTKSPLEELFEKIKRERQLLEEKRKKTEEDPDEDDSDDENDEDDEDTDDEDFEDPDEDESDNDDFDFFSDDDNDNDNDDDFSVDDEEDDEDGKYDDEDEMLDDDEEDTGYYCKDNQRIHSAMYWRYTPKLAPAPMEPECKKQAIDNFFGLAVEDDEAKDDNENEKDALMADIKLTTELTLPNRQRFLPRLRRGSLNSYVLTFDITKDKSIITKIELDDRCYSAMRIGMILTKGGTLFKLYESPDQGLRALVQLYAATCAILSVYSEIDG